MSDLSTRDYGDIAPLMKATTGLLSAAWAVYFGFRGRNKTWEPPSQPLSVLLSRVTAVAIAIGVAYVWYQLTDPDQAAGLLRLLWPAVAATFIAVLLYGFLLKVLVHNRKFSDTPGEMKSDKILGGFWKTKDAREAQRRSKVLLPSDELLWTMESNPNLVWSGYSQAWAQLTLNASYVLVIFLGAGTLTCGGAAIIAAQAPRIQEFATSHAQIKPGDSSILVWRVVNSKSVNLDPIGDVPPLGSRVVRLDKDTAYTLTAKNSFATVGVQQSIEVTPVSAANPSQLPLSPLPRNTASPVKIAVELDARECELIENVVIRGEGWLQNEYPGTATANCVVKLQRRGNYEIFVDYASQESRPVRITLNSRIIAENGLAAPTGGTGGMNQLDQSLGVYSVQQGFNVLQFRSERPLPYIRRVRFQPV